jgi:hypothetical protein
MTVDRSGYRSGCVTTDDPHRHESNARPSAGSAVTEPVADRPPLSPDSMNTFVDRHRDGSWCVWTTADGGNRVVSRHSTREQAEHAAAAIRGGDGRDLEA